MRSIDILFLAHNRIKFTEASLEALLKSCSSREKITVFVDGDVQGTAHLVRKMLRPKDVLIEGRWGGPVAITNAFLDRHPTDIFAKIDNDLIVHPKWLEVGLTAINQQPEFDLVGIAPICHHIGGAMVPPKVGGNKISAAPFIGGVGLFRRSSFDTRKRPTPSGRFGFTTWQKSQKVRCGWLNPPLPNFLLDHLPFDPWCSLDKAYRKKGWERPKTWGYYAKSSSSLWEWWEPNWQS